MNTYFSTNTTFRNNYVHDNWGEGIDFIQSNGGLAESNTVMDTYSVLIYVDGSDNIKILNNKLAVTKNTFNRPQGVANGVLLADESGGSSLSNITISGNKLYNTQGISTWNVTLLNSTESNNTTCPDLACVTN